MRQNAGICLNHNAHALHRPLVVSESMRHIRSITERSIIYAVSGYADRIMRSSRCGERSRDQDAIFGDPARIRSEEDLWVMKDIIRALMLCQMGCDFGKDVVGRF